MISRTNKYPRGDGWSSRRSYNLKCNQNVAFVQAKLPLLCVYSIVIISFVLAASYMLHIFYLSLGAVKLINGTPCHLVSDHVLLQTKKNATLPLHPNGACTATKKKRLHCKTTILDTSYRYYIYYKKFPKPVCTSGMKDAVL
jgi:hypothetical protein